MSREPEEPESGPDPGAGASSEAVPDADHDDTGLDLARSVARSLARPGATRRRSGPDASRRPSRRVDPQRSGAHPDDRDPQLLDSTIGRLIGDQGWGTDVRVHGVFSRWEVLVGHEVAAHCQPEAFTAGDPTPADAARDQGRDQGRGTDPGRSGGGRLVVRTDSTAWATQMRLLASTVLRRLNEELGEGTVAFIDVRGPDAPSWKRGRRSVRDGRGPRDTYG